MKGMIPSRSLSSNLPISKLYRYTIVKISSIQSIFSLSQYFVPNIREFNVSYFSKQMIVIVRCPRNSMNSLFDPSKTIHFNLLSMYDPLSVLDSYFYINLLLQKFRNNFFLFLLLSRIFPLLHWPHLLLHMSQHILEILTFNCI